MIDLWHALCSFQASPREDKNFRSDIDDNETEDASFSGQENLNDLNDILEWAMVCSLRNTYICYFVLSLMIMFIVSGILPICRKMTTDHYKLYASITGLVVLPGVHHLHFILWSTCIRWSIIDQPRQSCVVLVQQLIWKVAVPVRSWLMYAVTVTFEWIRLLLCYFRFKIWVFRKHSVWESYAHQT